MKKKWTHAVAKLAKDMSPFTDAVHVEFVWVEGDRRRDLDNVSAATKFILDGLVDAGVLYDDSQRWVRSLHHTICTSHDKTYGVALVLDTDPAILTAYTCP